MTLATHHYIYKFHDLLTLTHYSKSLIFHNSFQNFWCLLAQCFAILHVHKSLLIKKIKLWFLLARIHSLGFGSRVDGGKVSNLVKSTYTTIIQQTAYLQLTHNSNPLPQCTWATFQIPIVIKSLAYLFNRICHFWCL